MKNFVSKTLLVGATLGLASSAMGDVTIYLTGSTAFRQQVYNALTATKDSSNNFFFDHDGSYRVNTSFNGSKNQFLVQGHIARLGFTTSIVTVSCGFSGSVEGILAVLGQQPPSNKVLNNYLYGFASTNSAVYNSPTNQFGGIDASTVVPDFAFSDCQQSTTSYNPTVTGVDLNGGGWEIADATGTGIGIIPFGFAASVQTTGTHPSWPIANVTHQAAQAILTTGTTLLKQFTGNSGDTASVYLTGRYSLSGTRIITQADTGFGATRNGVLYTYVGGAATTTWSSLSGSADTVNGGYNSGGGVTGLLANGTSVPFLGYAGWPDLVSGSLAHPLTIATYDGVALSKQTVAQGQYSLWSAEHLYANTGLTVYNSDLSFNTAEPKVLFMVGNSNTDATLSNGFLGFLNTEIGSNANVLQVGAMHATRQVDGGNIVPLP